MEAPAVESVMLTVCDEVYVPVDGEMDGVAAGCCVVPPPAEYVHESICVMVCVPVPAVWIVKVMPSELALMNWNAKSLVKDCTFTGVVNHALPASPDPPSVSCKVPLLRLVRPLNCKPLEEVKLGKLMVEPPPPPV